MDKWVDLIQQCIGFEWDKANTSKSWLKHQVNSLESEEIFFNQPLIVSEDPQHSQKELRFYALGRTDHGRLLFVCFTGRKNFIRIISARDMSRKEREEYRQHEKENHTKI